MQQEHQAGSTRIAVHQDRDEGCREAAATIAATIRRRADDGCVLGLATGNTPVGVYRELVRLHREEGLSFARVTTFNLDEYYGIHRSNPQSYHAFMRAQLFDHVDIPASQTHIPDGSVPRADIEAHCRAYEDSITAAGGLDFQILGIGRTGHIGFNEPGSAADTRTRMVTLAAETRHDAANDFGDLEHVPQEALSMGIGTILEAKSILMLAWGASKAEIVARSLHQAPGPDLPATFLQNHDQVTYLLDHQSASQLESR